MCDFNKEVEIYQTNWRNNPKNNISTQTLGRQNRVERQWILPEGLEEEGLWKEIRKNGKMSLAQYLGDHVESHSGAHNLKSSWSLCANLYYPFRYDKDLIGSFLKHIISKHHISADIMDIESIELEFVEEDENLKPSKLLGEPASKKRGKFQTCPDIGFSLNTKNGNTGLILTENKYVEPNFYPCKGREAKQKNPDAKRCLQFESLYKDIHAQCWLMNWAKDRRPNRTYWKYLRISQEGLDMLTQCPAATSGYQLFRQQALAEALLQHGKYEFVISSVAYDKRNTTLVNSLSSAGINDFTTEWGKIFSGSVQFITWTHQQWVNWVEQHDSSGKWGDWLEYVKERYNY